LEEAAVRKLSTSLSAVLLAAAALAALAVSPATAAKKAKKPNIVVIMSDDQRQDDMIAMPKTKALLGKTGTTYRNSYVSYSLCCPSRTTFLTGQYSHNHHIIWNFPPEGGYPVFRKLGQGNTLPVWLQRAGYTTGLIGKYLNEYGEANPREIPPGWSDWQGAIDPTTYGQYDYKMNINGRIVRYGHRPRDYQTDVLTGRATDFIRRNSRPGHKPFFLWLTPNAPHTIAVQENGRREGTPTFPPPRYKRNRFSNAQIPRKPNFDEADVSDKPNIIKGFPRVTGAYLKLATAHYRGRLGALLGVDDMVQRVVGQLRRSGQLRNTVIIYTSDNGWLLGEHRIVGQKFFGFEESIRVPLLISGPGFARARSSDPVMNVDLAPTIAAAAGARTGRPQDGYALQRVRPGSLLNRNMVVETGKNSYGIPYYTGFHTGHHHAEDGVHPAQPRGRALRPAAGPVRADQRRARSALRARAGGDQAPAGDAAQLQGPQLPPRPVRPARPVRPWAAVRWPGLAGLGLPRAGPGPARRV